MLHLPEQSTEMRPPDGEQETRFLPHNIEAEQGLLGGLLLNNDAFNDVGDFLKKEHFFDPLHQRIFSALKNTDSWAITAATHSFTNLHSFFCASLDFIARFFLNR